MSENSSYFFIKINDYGVIQQVSTATFDGSIKVKVDEEFAEVFVDKYDLFIYMPGEPIGVCFPRDVQDFRINVLMESSDDYDEYIKKLKDTDKTLNDMLAITSQMNVTLQGKVNQLTDQEKYLNEAVAFLTKQIIQNKIKETS